MRGSLIGGESATVMVSFKDARVSRLPVGTHTATVTFTNKTNGEGDTTRTATLHRLNTNADPMDSEPVETLRAESTAYRAAGLEEAWRQMASMSERGLLNPVDIAIIDTNLRRPPAGSSGIEGIILSEFDWSNINDDHVSGATGLEDSQHGYGAASVIAAVNHAKNNAPDPSSFSGVVESVPGLEYHIDFHPVGVHNFSSGAMDRVDPIYFATGIADVAASSPDVVNISLGFPCAHWLEDVCTAAHAGGAIENAPDTIFVIAAGNNGGDARSTWPASIDADNVITVAATAPTGSSRAFWEGGFWALIFGTPASNYGPKISIAAPSGIYAVKPFEDASVYNPFEGTTSSAPLVSGVVALLRAIDPNISAVDVKELLKNTGNPITVCVADEDLPLSRCPAGKTEDWIVMNAGEAVKELMRQRGIPLADAYSPTQPPAEPDDHGDSRSSATGISAGSSASGVIGTASDSDYFSFQARRGREYTIETSIASGSDVDTFIALYSAGGSNLEENDDGGDGYASKIVWTAPSSGTYYVKVDGYGNTTGGYRLSVSASSPPPPTPPTPADDHGDSRSSATGISVGSSASGVIGTSSDVDYFSFQARRGREYTIETTIASGSDVDTVITLYAGNGSRLEENDDGDDGYASKIVWTAPSSGTYYVKVDGYGNTTGGYRLSVSARAATGAPVANVSRFSVPNAVMVGQSFNIRVELRNDGGDGERGGLSVSFPSLTGGSKSSGGWSSSLADVQVVGYTSGTGNVSLYKAGDSLNHANGSTISARHLLIETDDPSWRSNTRRELTVRVTPKRAGDLPVRARGWICADGYSDCARAPTYAANDQQGYSSAPLTVLVVASAPADDHGDDRASATALSIGSRVDGNIETRGDEDFFSFRARRGAEYTIETSVQARLDTMITLYSAQGGRLLQDNDDGVGRASKIEWTAPSSGTYYARVFARGGTVGAYELSLSDTTPAVGPVSFTLTYSRPPSRVQVGESFEIEGRVHRLRGRGDRGGVSISFPTLTGGRPSLERFESSAAVVREVDSNGMSVYVYSEGDIIDAASLPEMTARHLLFEGVGRNWSSSTDRTLRLRVTPKRAGEFPILIRAWVCAERYSQCSRSPVDGARDQQGMKAVRLSVTVVDPEPTPVTRVTPVPSSGAGGRIAFSSGKDGDFEIYTVNPDGSGLVQLTDNRDEDFDPSWVSGAGRVAFTSDRDGNNEIYAMNADGSGVARLTNNSAYDERPSWSPDGRRIAFASTRDGNEEIYAMNADGTGLARLTNNSASDTYPSWSPDGRRIAFQSNRNGNSEIYAMNADGTGAARLTDNSAGDYQPSWSPDGRRIAFVSNRDGNDEIYLMNANGSGQTRLTNTSSSDYAPSWSPDGRRIAFESFTRARDEIYAINADGSGLTRVTTNAVDVWGPSWAR